MSITDLEFMIQRFSAGSVSVGELETLAHFAKDKDLAVELGTNIGTTAIMLKAVAKRVCTVDVFERIELIEDPEQRKVYQTSFDNNGHYFSTISGKLRPFGIEVFNMLSYKFADKFHSGTIDLIFIDADHSYNGVKKDYDAWFSKVKPGGYFVFHDCIPAFPCFKFINDVVSKDKRVEYIPYATDGISSMKVFWKLP